MTTVTAVLRAVGECIDASEPGTYNHAAFVQIARSPAALTILANRLSDRGEAGNAAARSNLIVLEAIKGSPGLSKIANNALEWAIDQLTPPIINQPINTGA